ncbi:MAG: regulatory protein RecX, partial [Balneolaceae bacterium]
MEDRTAGTGRKITFPVMITSVERQKKHPDRFSVYHNDQLIIGISVDILIRFDLRKGLEMTSGLYDRISEEEEKNSVKEYFLRLLGRRDHSRGELKRKALNRGCDPEYIERVLQELDQKGTLDDEAFARKFASDKLERQRWGPVKIRAALMEKGISRQTADRILSDLSDDLELKRICVDLALKRTRH